MKISIKSVESRNFCLWLPTRLMCSPRLIWFILNRTRKDHPSVPDISLESLRELRRIILNAKRRKGGWVLVDVQSSDDDSVKITL